MLAINPPTAGSDDAMLISAMQALGWLVTLISDVTVTTASGNGRDLIFISEGVLSGLVNTKFRLSPVPVVLTEGFLFDDMSMVNVATTVAAQTQVALINTPNPFSNPDAGNQTVLTVPDSMFWGDANPATALLWGTIVGFPVQYSAFAYEVGALMVAGLNAPARRAGFGVNTSKTILTQNAKCRTYILNLCLWAMGAL